MPTPRELAAQQLTSTTRVIVSFGAREGGFELTAQLRLDIMDRYGKRRVLRDPAGKWLQTIADDAFCYLDAITLKDAEGTKYDQLALPKTIDGKEQWVKVDLNKMANPFWDTYYPAAVANAAVMIFQITKPWLASEYCLEELGWFIVQGLSNLDKGKESPCIFMVFPEAETEFQLLLTQLRQGLSTRRPSACIDGNKYKRMLKGFATLDVPYADVASGAGAAKLASLRGRVERLFTAMASRCMQVPPGFGALSFTDYHGQDQARLAQDPALGVPAHMYSNTFEYNYNITEAFQKKLFELLDKDLAKVGILPVAPS